MENASKALLMASAILFAILIIAIGIYMFNRISGNTNTHKLDALAIQTFNSPFLQYEGKQVIGSDVIKLLDYCMENARANDGADEKLPDVLYVDARNNDYILQSVLGSGASSNYDADNVFYTASGQNTRMGYIANSLGISVEYGIKRSSFGISVKSGNISDAISKLVKLKAIIAENQYYKVAFHIDDKVGVVDFVGIKYIKV